MSKRIVIVGAGGFGRGVYSWLRQSTLHCEIHKIENIVFIDDSEPRAKPNAPIIGTVSDYVPEPQDEVLVAVGVPGIRRAIVESLESRGARFHTFIDDRAALAESVGIGMGSIICPGAVISADATVGSHVHINFNCAVGHDAVLGDFTTLSPLSNIMGETVVGREVFVGGSAVVLPRLRIGHGVVVGAGATLVNEVTNRSTVMGNPAR